jgi:hypothetical protein
VVRCAPRLLKPHVNSPGNSIKSWCTGSRSGRCIEGKILSAIALGIKLKFFGHVAPNLVPIWLFPSKVPQNNVKLIDKNLKYCEYFQICSEISRKFLSSNFQYFSNIPALPTAFLVCLFPLSYCYRGPSPVATPSLSAKN